MKQRVTLNDKTFEVMIPAEEIDKAVEKVAEQLNKDYAESEKAPIFVGVLNGSYMFLSDLVRKTTFNNEVTFVRISSYEGTQSTGSITQKSGIDFDIEGRDIIIVEDIVDSGVTLNYLRQVLIHRGAASLKIAALLDKPARRKIKDLKVDYVCFDIPDAFVVGYGLDYAGKYRNLKYVGTLRPEVYSN